MLPNPKAYEMNAAGEQSYKNEVDRYNQANPNGQIKYTARSTYNTPQPVTQTGNVYSVGTREFINKQDAQNWTNNPGLVNQQPQDLPVRTTQHIDLLTNSTLASDRATSAGFQPWQDTTGNRSLTYVPKTLQTGNDADPVWTAGGYTEREKAVLVNNYYKAHPELGVTPAQNMPLTDTDVAAQNSAEYKAQMDYLDAQNDFTVQKSREQTAGAQGAAKANIGAVNREGVQSSSNLATSAEIIKRFSANQSNLEAQLAEQKRQLQVAQNAGLTKQAEQIAASISSTQQTILANAERSTNEVKNIISQGGLVGLNDAQLEDLSASTNIPTYALKAIQKTQNLQYGTEQQKQQTQALDNVMTLASQGALTVPMAISMAKQYNLPLDGIMGVVQASQIAGAGKQVALAQAQQNLSDQVNHLNTAAAQNVAYLNQLRKDGASNEQIAAFKQMAGITDYNDPLTKAKLALAYAQTDKERADAYQAGIDSGLISGAVVPSQGSGKYSAYLDNNGNFSIDVADGSTGGQCGHFVNDYMGTRIIQDSKESKLKLIDKSIGFGEGQTPPSPGAIGVMGAGPYGHVFIFEGTDDKGNAVVKDSNWHGDEKVATHTIPLSSINGYFNPPNAAKAGSVAGMSDQQILSAYESAGKVFTKPSEAQAAISTARRTGFVPGVNTGSEMGPALNKVPKDYRSEVTQKANQFDGEQQVKNFQTVQTMYNKALSVDNNTDSPQDDQLLVYTFAKAMDPNSSVREGEYDTVQKFAQTALQRFGVNTERFYSNAPFLTPDARKNIKDSIKKAYDSEKTSYDQVRNQYIKSIDSLAGTKVGSQILQDYTTGNAQSGNDPLGLGFSNQKGADPLSLGF